MTLCNHGANPNQSLSTPPVSNLEKYNSSSFSISPTHLGSRRFSTSPQRVLRHRRLGMGLALRIGSGLSVIGMRIGVGIAIGIAIGQLRIARRIVELRRRAGLGLGFRIACGVGAEAESWQGMGMAWL